MSKFYQRYITGTKKTSEEEKILSKPINVVRPEDPTAMAPSHISKRPVNSTTTKTTGAEV